MEPSRSMEEMLHPRVVRAMTRLGYKRLLPVQEKAIPVILRGANTLIIAPTGSGKTEAALLPVLSMILSRSSGEGVKAVYVTPMRSLNRDITWRMEKLVSESGLRLGLRHGDSTQSERRRFINSPPDIMVTTPESLNLLLTVESARKVLAGVRWIIVDEVHELLDSKRGTEFSVVLERMEAVSRYRLQRIGLSATLSKRSIEEAKALLACCRRVEVVEDSSVKHYQIQVRVTWGSDFWESAAREIAKIVASTHGSILVFTNTRSTAEKLATTLSSIMKDEKIEVHHGSLSRYYREGAEKRFREGKTRILVATSSMELGIDVGSIELVIQFLSPRQVRALIQRVGRSGHKIGDTSKGIIVTMGNLYEVLESLVIAHRAVRGKLEDLEAPKDSYDALAHQMVAMVKEGSATSLNEILELASRAGPYKGLDQDTVERVAMHLDKLRILRLKDGRLKEGRRARKYLYSVSMIPDEVQFKVVDMISGDIVGSVGERFIEVSSLTQGNRFKFILAGRVWEALEVDYEAKRLNAKPLGEIEGAIPSWEGELIPVDYKVAREVCSLIHLGLEYPEDLEDILRRRGLDEESTARILRILKETMDKWGEAPPPGYVGVEQAEDSVVVHACLGSKGNFALALLLSKILERIVEVEIQFMPYAIILATPGGLKASLVAKALEEALEMDHIERVSLIQDSVRSSRSYLIRLIHVAKRMGMLDPDKSVPLETLKRLRDSIRGTIVDEEVLREVAYDKLDYRALNRFLDEARGAWILWGPSRLTKEVLDNPYIKRDVGANIKALALDQIVKAIQKRVSRKTIILQCARCGHYWTTTAVEASARIARCSKCMVSLIAPLPDTEWGRETAEIYKRYKQGVRVRGEKAKRVKEVQERAQLYLNYAVQGMSRYVIEALSTPGVGPHRAKRVLDAGIKGGDRSFYKELIRAEEEYLANRKYWKQ